MPLRNVKVDLEAIKEPPQSQQRDLDRPTAVDIYEQVSRNAKRELQRPAIALALSGIVGGLTMGLTGLSVSVVRALLGDTSLAQFVSLVFYPMGFMAVILGRGQLFTENTLYPVALILAERRHFLSTARLWAIVFPANVAGAFLFALLAARTKALHPETLHILVQLGTQAASPGGQACVLERSDWRVDDRNGGVAGKRQPLDHRVGCGDLGADVHCRSRAFRPLHRNERRGSCSGADPRGFVERLSAVAAAGDSGKYFGRCSSGDAARIRPGETGLTRVAAGVGALRRSSRPAPRDVD